MAQSGQKVLLIDTDLRRPRMHKSLGVSKERGLTSFETLDAGEREEKHGRFSIAVFPDAARARRERLLRQPRDLDEHGVAWDEGEQGWIATKLYGDVQLQWLTDERELDGRWQLHDRVLSELG